MHRPYCFFFCLPGAYWVLQLKKASSAFDSKQEKHWACFLLPLHASCYLFPLTVTFTCSLLPLQAYWYLFTLNVTPQHRPWMHKPAKYSHFSSIITLDAKLILRFKLIVISISLPSVLCFTSFYNCKPLSIFALKCSIIIWNWKQHGMATFSSTP